MKIWMTAECESNIANIQRDPRNRVEDVLNEYLKDKKYGIKLNSWGVIIVLMEDDSYDERTIY